MKEANVAGIDQRAKTSDERREQARTWADILRWELENVQPKHVFCVGGASFDLVNRLQSERLLPGFYPISICHYSARGREQDILEKMLLPIQKVIGSVV